MARIIVDEKVCKGCSMCKRVPAENYRSGKG